MLCIEIVSDIQNNLHTTCSAKRGASDKDLSVVFTSKIIILFIVSGPILTALVLQSWQLLTTYPIHEIHTVTQSHII